ncbi:MAG: thiamine pyrophosphate-dependent enzyme, partial [Oscillospiraceae bacterium]|nr:thiamine pyrophosphate-dependent enzyme [Oscillospiraceae bacterium]
AGMVCAVADDPGMHSSQNEQDSRHHAYAAKVPMLEPCDSSECLRFTKLAYELSEQFDTPVLLRLSTRISHGRSPVEIGERTDVPVKPYKKDAMKNVMMPAMARGRHPLVERRTEALREWAESAEINRVEYFDRGIGIIAAGNCSLYAREAMGERASYFKLGMVNPLPVEALREFAAQVGRVVVVEELDDVIETHCRKYGITVEGKNLFSFCGELSQSIIREALLGEKLASKELAAPLPPRPPVLCAGCPHRGVFTALKKCRVFVSGDIGCYTLGAGAPLSMMDTCVCMGASVSGLHGYSLATGNPRAVAIIGDSTFVHSGITGLIDIAYNKGISTVIVLDNSTTGMTGHQNNPANGRTLYDDPTTAIDLEALARAVGIGRVRVVDPYDVEGTRAAVEEELNADAPSLIIARAPCVLLKSVPRGRALVVDKVKCTGCKACLQVGCPALTSPALAEDGKAAIDADACTGCTVCAQMCKFGAIG